MPLTLTLEVFAALPLCTVVGRGEIGNPLFIVHGGMDYTDYTDYTDYHFIRIITLYGLYGLYGLSHYTDYHIMRIITLYGLLCIVDADAANILIRE